MLELNPPIQRSKKSLVLHPPGLPTLGHYSPSVDLAQQLRLQDVFPLLILLGCFIGLVVFPAHRLLALPTCDIPHHVPPGRHIPLHGFGLRDVDDGVEEIGFAVLAAEIL